MTGAASTTTSCRRSSTRDGYGLRVPGIVISPYAKQGYIDHQTLSFDAYTKFIEDDFLDSARLDPATDGRPDPRPDVRENNPILGDLAERLRLQPDAPPAADPARSTRRPGRRRPRPAVDYWAALRRRPWRPSDPVRTGWMAPWTPRSGPKSPSAASYRPYPGRR